MEHNVEEVTQKIYYCNFNRKCKKKFVSERNRNIHVDKMHKGNKKFSCEDCGHQTIRKKDMKSHMKIHERDPVICVQCGTQLKNNYRLKQHIDSQHNPGNLNCEVCCKNFGNKSDLRLHKKTCLKMGNKIKFGYQKIIPSQSDQDIWRPLVPSRQESIQSFLVIPAVDSELSSLNSPNCVSIEREMDHTEYL